MSIYKNQISILFCIVIKKPNKQYSIIVKYVNRKMNEITTIETVLLVYCTYFISNYCSEINSKRMSV